MRAIQRHLARIGRDGARTINVGSFDSRCYPESRCGRIELARRSSADGIVRKINAWRKLPKDMPRWYVWLAGQPECLESVATESIEEPFLEPFDPARSRPESKPLLLVQACHVCCASGPQRVSRSLAAAEDETRLNTAQVWSPDHPCPEHLCEVRHSIGAPPQFAT